MFEIVNVVTRDVMATVDDVATANTLVAALKTQNIRVFIRCVSAPPSVVTLPPHFYSWPVLPPELIEKFDLGEPHIQFVPQFDSYPAQALIVEDNKLVRLSLLKALKRAFPHKPESVLGQVWELLQGYYTVSLRDISTQIVHTAEEISAAYTSSISLFINGDTSLSVSCMQKVKINGVHPAIVYATRHLLPPRYHKCSLALLIAKNRDDQIVGRVVVWPHRKIHSKIYAEDKFVYRALLWSLFVQNFRFGSLAGAFLARIPIDPPARFLHDVAIMLVRAYDQPYKGNLIYPQPLLDLAIEECRAAPHYLMPFVDHYDSDTYLVRELPQLNVFILHENGRLVEDPSPYTTNGTIRVGRIVFSNLPQYYLTERFTLAEGSPVDPIFVLDFDEHRWNTNVVFRAERSAFDNVRLHPVYNENGPQYYITDAALARYQADFIFADLPLICKEFYLFRKPTDRLKHFYVFHEDGVWQGKMPGDTFYYLLVHYLRNFTIVSDDPIFENLNCIMFIQPNTHLHVNTLIDALRNINLNIVSIY